MQLVRPKQVSKYSLPIEVASSFFFCETVMLSTKRLGGWTCTFVCQKMGQAGTIRGWDDVLQQGEVGRSL
jgi:hypothetical protein